MISVIRIGVRFDVPLMSALHFTPITHVLSTSCDRAKWTGDCFLSPRKVTVSYQSKIETRREVTGASALRLSKMASRPTLHEDLTSAFIRYRDGQGQYDPLLDRKKCYITFSGCFQHYFDTLQSTEALVSLLWRQCFAHSFKETFLPFFRKDKSWRRKDPKRKWSKKHFSCKPSFYILDGSSSSCVLLLRFLYCTEVWF